MSPDAPATAAFSAARTMPAAPTTCTIHTGIHPGPVPILELPWPDDCGGECIFVGRTRGENHPQFGRLLRLEYEMYEPMADRIMQGMALDAVQRFACRAVRIVHAKGAVDIGQASVVIQAATAHRAESFAACRHLIERIKHELPVWKHEIWEHGRTFVQGSCARPA